MESAMPNPNFIHHIHIKCDDPQAAAEWYGQVFGASVVMDATRPSGERFIRCALGGKDGPLLIFSNPAPGLKLPKGQTELTLGLEHFAIATDNLEKLIEKACAHGATLIGEQAELADGTLIAFVATPEDVRIELMQLPS